jgi:pimeloyl-ACP methyl ester carboxylesterase
VTDLRYRNPYEQLPPRPAPRGFAERRFDAGSATLAYVAGPDDGRTPLVLLPAQTGTWQSYTRVLRLLARDFTVYAVDPRGHGRSSWTPGDYSWTTFGRDIAAFLAEVVGRPAIVSGNSSGGLIALWCAANVPDRVAGLVLEDAPVFSAELPRFRDRDRWVYEGLVHAVEALGDLEHRDLADYLRGQTLPVSETRERRIPGWFLDLLSRRIKAVEAARPGEPPDLRGWPTNARQLVLSIAQFDPDVARAFVDGRVYEGLDHAEALSRVRCPVLVLHADWLRTARHGLVGAMDDEDAARIRALVPAARYQRVHANHVIHHFKPRAYVDGVRAFARQPQDRVPK